MTVGGLRSTREEFLTSSGAKVSIDYESSLSILALYFCSLPENFLQSAVLHCELIFWLSPKVC